MADSTPNAGGPGSSSRAHPQGGIPLPAHGFDTLDLPEPATVPATEVIDRCGAVLMSAAADRLGLTPGEEPVLDMAEARALIDGLAGLLAAALPYLDERGAALRDGLRTLQHAYREASATPVADGAGPGEALLN